MRRFFEWLMIWLQLRKPPHERVELLDDGFRHWRDDVPVGKVPWADVARITAFKRDGFTIDFVCLEFFLRSSDTYWVLDDDVEGFWPLVERIKSVFPDSNQRWEETVVKPAFVENATVIFERTTP